MAIDVLRVGYNSLQVGQGNATSASEGTLQGYSNAHWSVKILIAGAIVGVITALVGLVLNQFALAAAGVFFVLTNGLGAHYIAKFSPYRDAGGLIDAMSQRIYGFWEQIVNLQKEVERAEEHRKQLKEAVLKIENLLKEKEKIGQDNRKLVKDFEQVQKKLTQVSQIYQPLKSAVDQFFSATAEFSGSEQHLEANLKQFIEQVIALGVVRQSLKAEIEAFGKETKKLPEYKVSIESSIKTLDRLLKEWPQTFADLKECNRKMREEVRGLKKCIGDLEKSTTEFREIKEYFDTKILPALQHGLPDKKQLHQMMNDLKKKLDSNSG